MKRPIVFDLDGTLAESKSSLDVEMSVLLHDLLGIVTVVVISGGAWPQFEKQLLSNLPYDQHLANLFLLPACGTQFFQYSGDWKKIYSEDLTTDERQKILSSLKKAIGSGLQGRKALGRGNKKQALSPSRSEIPMRRNGLSKRLPLVWEITTGKA